MMIIKVTAHYSVASPNFVVWKCCGSEQSCFFCVTVGYYAFPQNFHTSKFGES